MGRTKLDNRIRTLIENGVKERHRSMFVVIGNKARDQVPTLHHILAKATITARPSVLWCYKSKENLGFTSHRKKRENEIKKKIAAGVMHAREDDPFELFISSTEVRYCYYSESEKILGNTFGMLVLQDFEALTPNLLARTVETIEGGGLVVFLLQSVNSLKQLYTLSMDVHSRFRTEAHSDVVGRFNERFILSLSCCKTCVVMDDHLNVLPISSHITKIAPVLTAKKSEESEELVGLKEAMSDTKPIGPLLNLCKTADQAKVLLRLLDTITEKTLNATCSVTAARGRGKSAALGLAVAGAIGFGFTNIFVTSPSPENLRTLFEFIVKGLDAMDYQEHADFEILRSLEADQNKCVIRINITRDHRQNIQYIQPSEAGKLDQAELVVIDEAAAIPIPLVKKLISGPYLVFLASTINGYEGTGRSLALKLLAQLRQQASGIGGGSSQALDVPAKRKKQEATVAHRKLHELTLEESIRYNTGDQIELWLNKLLCLDSTTLKGTVTGTPPPNKCDLYYVNRDTLFSFHQASEQFLSSMMSIYVSAHYKNTPNDLQMLSDAPAHHLFVLMAPVTDEQTSVPQILAVLQVCLEGTMSKSKVAASMDYGRRASGDLIPWTISQHFLDTDFPTLNGVRIVRIAVHPDFQGMGYGSWAMQLLIKYYTGAIPYTRSEDGSEDSGRANGNAIINTLDENTDMELLEEQVEPRDDLPPLLLRLDERRADRLDYVGVSFGLTLSLLKFWKRLNFVPVYVKQTTNDLTGEHTCIMLRTIPVEAGSLRTVSTDGTWLYGYFCEFRHRFISLLSSVFAHFPAHLAFSLLHNKASQLDDGQAKVLSRDELSLLFSNMDLRRLSHYARNLSELYTITDLLPAVASAYFSDKIDKDVDIDLRQAAVLLSVGLQRKSVEKTAGELGLPLNQANALLNKPLRRISAYFDSVCKQAIENQAIENQAEAQVERMETS